MATSYSTNLALALPATGELSGTWGTTVNANITNMLDEALGYQAFSATGGSDTLTIPDGTTGVARSIYIQLNGTGGGTVNVPATKTKMYFVFNYTASAITFKVTGQTGVSIPAAAKMALVSNGTDIIVAENYFSALTLGAALPAASGGTGVANNAAMTVTGSGNFAYTRTLTAATNVTFPTTGTLSTLAGTETLTNKTLTSPTLTTPVLGTPSSGTLSSCTVDGTDAVGFRNIPISSKSTAYTTVLADSGKVIFHPSTDANARTFTIDSNANVAYPLGTAITFINMTSNVVTIAITTDTMYLSSAGTTGSRSLAQYGSATAIKMTSTTWLISGSGLT